MPKWKTGDRVRVVQREQNANDIRENAYFPHLAGLEGTVAKVYSPEEVCVIVDRETLPEENSVRHGEIENRLQERWLDSISQEARSNLSEAEKVFNLNYTILIASTDLEPAKGARKPAAKPSEKQASKDERPHLKDLEQSEEEFLKQRGKS